VSPTLLAGLARAVFPDRDPVQNPGKNPAAVDFGELDTTIRSIAARAHGHYVALVEEPASHIAPPASQQDQKLP
jgi:[glutamine synthetase] adenylyltransferase / [glutamine synthetase]-adenylyl-L-tyrosine phosphorylase